ncbi:bacteriophage abortive infection AbiH family protein [Clostridium folliculivorans]|uniref:Bacteriophage abortive infection AbiH n=1 Tax=Clostridium folliculivorans TaxID=2886038 RepID=A0A9W5Y0F2_9CLOT|nr:bacteriophage abortive infection AbiH family protein [Clostridium folliculivorans]GKU24292.1 hypothetical protein CFOLD11_11180 [Clostridium folliculivorans]GKU30397.1 hypothetical protein CFB3_25040 [Clostridium folliculivorans]
MDLFVIGNGFDLAHGLKTSYGDFRDYLERENTYFLSKFEKMYGIGNPDWIDKIGEDIWKKDVKNMLWRDFEGNLPKIDESIISDGEDIELGIQGEDSRGRGDSVIGEVLDKHWKEEFEFIEKLGDIVSDWINQIELKISRKAKLIDKENYDKFLTFNYTLLLEEVYKVSDSNILHIHGSGDDNTIIGHGDEKAADEMRKEAEEAKDNFNQYGRSIYEAIASYYDNTLKKVKDYIESNRNFFEKLNNIKSIHIIGHSLGDVDMPYFQEIKNNVNKDTMWNIYYYCESDREVYKDKIMSLGVSEDKIKLSPTEYFFSGEIYDDESISFLNI